MNRLEPNLLLAVSTGIALILLVVTAGAFGQPGAAVKYPIIALVCVIAFVFGNALLARRMNRITPPMIHPETPATAAWAGIFPVVVMAFAAVPVFWTGHDYGLLVIIGAVMFGVTVESAVKARRPR